MPAIQELEGAYAEARDDPEFSASWSSSRDFVGRPTPLYEAPRLSASGGCRGLPQARRPGPHRRPQDQQRPRPGAAGRRMGKKRIIAETGAGQHGVATATVCAKLGLECVVYMGTEDIRRQSVNVFRMELLGAEVRPVESGTRTLKDAINEAMRDWVTNVRDDATTSSARRSGRTPTRPSSATSNRSSARRRAQQILGAGRAAAGRRGRLRRRRQQLDRHVPPAFVDDAGVELIGVEAGGRGMGPNENAATLSNGSVGVLHGTRTYLLQDRDGQILGTHSVSAGLDYPGRRAGAQLSPRRSAGRSTWRSTIRPRWRASASSAEPRGSSRPWSRRTPSPTRAS